VNDSSVYLLFVDTMQTTVIIIYDCLMLSSGYCDSFLVCLHMNRLPLYDIYHILGEKWLMGNMYQTHFNIKDVL